MKEKFRFDDHVQRGVGEGCSTDQEPDVAYRKKLEGGRKPHLGLDAGKAGAYSPSWKEENIVFNRERGQKATVRFITNN